MRATQRAHRTIMLASCQARASATVFALLTMALPLPGLTITAQFDSTITSDPQAATIQSTIQSAIATYQFNYSDNVTVAITFQEVTTGLGASSTYNGFYLYTDYRNALNSQATSDDDEAGFATLPNTTNNPVTNDPRVRLTLPLSRALGFGDPVPSAQLTIETCVIVVPDEPASSRSAVRQFFSRETTHHLTGGSSIDGNPPAGQPDGVISLNTSICNLSPAQTDPTKYSLYAVVCHEIDEVLGSGSRLDGLKNGDPAPPTIKAEDLYRFDDQTTPVRSFTTAVSAKAYFSLDGHTLLSRYNQTQGGDFGDWYSPGSGAPIPQVQDAFQTAGATPVPKLELRVLDALGWNRVPAVVFVDFSYGGTQTGTFRQPYQTLAAGRDGVKNTGTVKFKGPQSAPTTMTINKAMSLDAIGGPVTIGQ